MLELTLVVLLFDWDEIHDSRPDHEAPLEFQASNQG